MVKNTTIMVRHSVVGPRLAIEKTVKRNSLEVVFGEAGEDVIDGHDMEVLDSPKALHRPQQADERDPNLLVRVVDEVRYPLQESKVAEKGLVRTGEKNRAGVNVAY